MSLNGSELVDIQTTQGNGTTTTGSIAALSYTNPAISPPSNWQIVTNRSAVPSSIRQGTAGGRTDVQIQKRYAHLVGNQAVGQLKAGMTCFYLTLSGESLIGNSFNWEAAFELLSPSTYQETFTFNTNLPASTDGTPFILNDQAMGYTIPAGGTIEFRQAVSVGVDTSFMPVGSGGQATGDTSFISPSATSQVPGTGVMTQPSGGTSFGASFGFILGVPKAPMAAVCYVGDSIPNGTGDTTDTLGNIGYIARGLEAVNGFSVPYLNQTVGSWTLSAATVDVAPRIRSMWQFVTHIIFELGTNDVAAAASLSSLQTNLTQLCTAAKTTIGPYGKPLKVAVCTLLPRVTSTDSYATAAGQTPVAGFTVGGVRDQYNAWIKSQVGLGLIDAVIDPCPYVEDGTYHGVWVTNGVPNYPTTDGVHPTTAFHIRASNAVNLWALGIAP